jgi:flagellar basal-body rod protein FlgB
MSWLDTDAIQEISRYMSLTDLREKLVVGNIANIDTPGYKTLDINFHDALRQADKDPADTPSAPPVEQTPDLIQRPDGNNVSLDRESIILAGVQLEYRTAIALLRQQFNLINMAINENNGA